MESNDETVAEAMLRLFCIPHKAYGRAVVDEMCLIVAKLFLCLDDEGDVDVYALSMEHIGLKQQAYARMMDKKWRWRR